IGPTTQLVARNNVKRPFAPTRRTNHRSLDRKDPVTPRLSGRSESSSAHARPAAPASSRRPCRAGSVPRPDPPCWSRRPRRALVPASTCSPSLVGGAGLPPPLGFGSGGCSAPPAEHASPPPLVSLRLDVAQPDVRSHLLAGVPLLFRRRRGEDGARHRDEALPGADIPLQLAPLVGVRRRHLP